MDTDYAGKPIKSHKLIGYNPKTKAFFSYVYSNNAPDPYETISTIHNDRKSQVALQLRKGGSLVVIKKKRNCKIYHF